MKSKTVWRFVVDAPNGKIKFGEIFNDYPEKVAIKINKKEEELNIEVTYDEAITLMYGISSVLIGVLTRGGNITKLRKSLK